MPSLQALVLIVNFTETTVAIALNTIIVVFCGARVKNGLKRSLGELIQLVMGVVNITMRCSTAAQMILSVLVSSFCSAVRELCSLLAFLQLCHMCFSFWLTAYLCAYYCTTITNSSHWLFVWMKKTLSSRLPLLLLASGFGSFLVTFPLVLEMQISPEQPYSTNSTSVVWVLTFNVFSLMITSIFGCFLPFFFISISVMITVFSLVRHILRMRHNVSGFALPKLQAHTSAIRTMLLFLTLSIVFYTCETLLFIEHSINDPMIYVRLMITTIFPTAEAAIIIQSNPQLRKSILGKFCRGRLQGNNT